VAVVAKIASEFDDAGVKAASKAFGDVRRTFKELSDDADDTRGAGEKLGEAYSKAAERLKAELSNLQATSAVVADSLGPEMVQAIESSGRSVESYVQDWRKMGLTFDDITADSEFLAQGLKDLDAAGRVAGDNVGEGLRKVAEQGDKSKSVLANMVGNSVQDLGQLGGIAGSASVMIGQLAEYATEGGISLKSLAGVAGPMAAVGLAVAAISSAMADAAAEQQFLKDQTQEFIGVLNSARNENTSATTQIVKGWEKAGKIEAQISNATATLVEFGQATDDMAKIHELKYPQAEKKVVDFAAEIDKLGMTAEDFAMLTTQPIEKIQEWGAAMVESGKDGKQVNLVMQGAAAMSARYAEAQDTASVSARIFGKTGVNAANDVVNANFDLVGSIDAVVDAERRKKDAIMASIDANFAVFDATNNYKQALDDLALAHDDPKTSVNEYDVALNDAAKSALEMAQAEVDLAAEQAAREGVTLSADRKNQIMVDGLKKTADTLAAGSPLRIALEQYIAALSMVPADVSTAVRLMADVNTNTRYNGPRASGGPVAAGEPYLVGERGPEIVVPSSSGTVVPADRSARMMGGGSDVLVVQLYVGDRAVQELAVRMDDLKRGRR